MCCSDSYDSARTGILSYGASRHISFLAYSSAQPFHSGVPRSSLMSLEPPNSFHENALKVLDSAIKTNAVLFGEEKQMEEWMGGYTSTTDAFVSKTQPRCFVAGGAQGAQCATPTVRALQILSIVSALLGAYAVTRGR
jgi:hypothetical protein